MSTTDRRDGVDVQRARDGRLSARGRTRFTTRRWELSDLPTYQPATSVSGNLRICGLNYVCDSQLAEYWVEGFRRYHPLVRFSFYTPTTLAAMHSLCFGQADLGMTRAPTFDELLTFQRIFYYLPLQIVMATGSYDVAGWSNALGIYVHQGNPLSRITFRQLDGVFGAERTGGYHGTTWDPSVARGPEQNIRVWGQLGLTGEWANQPIVPYGLNLRYHQPLRIEERVFNGGTKWNERLREYSNYARADGTFAGAARELVNDLGQDRYGIAYSGPHNATPEVKALAVAERDGGDYVELSLETVRARTYPLLDEPYWLVNRRPGEPVAPLVREFLRYTLSQEGQDAVQRDAHYLPLTGAAVQDQLAKLE